MIQYAEGVPSKDDQGGGSFSPTSSRALSDDDLTVVACPLQASIVTEKGPTVNLISMRMDNHAGRCGYDRLLDYIDGNVIIGSNSPSLAQRAISKLLRPMVRNSGSLWYHRSNLLGELSAARRWRRGGDKQIFHFLYGENSFRYLGHMKTFVQHAIVGTYHTPNWRMQELVTKQKHLRMLDAVVVVSSTQFPFFERFLSRERTIFIPHGIDTDFFSPVRREESNIQIRCIMVGHHLRDFDTLIGAARMVCKGRRDVKLVVVTRADKHHLFAGLPEVEVHSGVSDKALRALYRSSDILLLPLLDCTANNALLEGMACGLPVVATDLPGVRDYFHDDCGLLTPKNDAKALANAVLTLSGDHDLRRRMGAASREMALRFTWTNIAQEFSALYRKLAA